MSDRVEVYRDAGGEWRWRRVAGNHRQTGASGEGFTRRWSAKRAAKKANPGIPITVLP